MSDIHSPTVSVHSFPFIHSVLTLSVVHNDNDASSDSFFLDLHLSALQHNQSLIDMLLNDSSLWQTLTDGLHSIFQMNQDEYTIVLDENTTMTRSLWKPVILVSMTNCSSSNTFSSGIVDIEFNVSIDTDSIDDALFAVFLESNHQNITLNLTSAATAYLHSTWPSTVHHSHPQHSLSAEEAATNNVAPLIAMGSALVVLVLLSAVPIRWYLKRQKAGKSKTKRRARSQSSECPDSFTPNTDIFAVAMQPRKPEVIDYVMSKHGARASASMQSRENSRNTSNSANSTRKNSSSSMVSVHTKTATQSENALPPSFGDKKSVFDSDVRNEAVHSLEWAPEPDPEEESTSSLRLGKEEGIDLELATCREGVGALGSGDAVIVFGDAIGGGIRVRELEDVATYSSSDGDRDVL